MSPSTARMLLRAAQLALAVFVAAYLWYFADHAWQLLRFPFPLDYGEGPLQAQVDRLRSGVPIWSLYADPSAPPFLIVNYPPLYLLLTAALSPLAGSALVAGRLISLLATLGSVAAIAVLCAMHSGAHATDPAEPGATPSRPHALTPSRPHALTPSRPHALTPSRPHAYPPLLALLFLTVPVVREWSALMRVDMLGVCLGLWALVALRHGVEGRSRGTEAGTSSTLHALRSTFPAALLLLACLFTKPSLLAAPLAAGGWLLWRVVDARGAARRQALQTTAALAATVALGGMVILGLLQWASGGWFFLHAVAANANRWDAELARGFWEQQLALRWPLAAAAALAAALVAWRGAAPTLVMPGIYTLGGVIVAAGVGKVGAYSNYFLELYAGLVWLVALGAGSVTDEAPQRDQQRQPHPPTRHALRATCYALLAASLLYYPPLWDASRLRPAGLIEPSPPRLAFGRYGLWADAARERALLAAQSRVGEALVATVQAAGPIVFTDMPGVAAAAGVTSRVQAFEARQLFDQGLASDDALLLELANGAPPLAVLDYLGNWLTPGMITILQRRYAHDGSLGTFDLYRPVDAGPPRRLGHTFAAQGGPLALESYRLAAPLGDTYEPGELLALSLIWRRDEAPPLGELTVVVQLTTPEGAPLLENERPLLYGALPPDRWPRGAPVEHMQPLELPAELPDGRYAIAVGLRAAGERQGPPQIIGALNVAHRGGSYAETGHFVPAMLQQAWAELGATERAGLPLTPAVPFAWGRLQCFERVCLELRDGQAAQRPLGATLYRAETIRGDACAAGELRAPGALCPSFEAAPLTFADIGAALSGELARNGWVVQWTEHARLERAPVGGPPALGRLGDESLRLPPGARYRWP